MSFSPAFKIVIAGRTGRMGQEIEAVASEFGLQVIGGLDRNSTGLEDLVSKNSRPDVVVDFSLPQATVEICRTCEKYGIPLVSGVTGLTASDRKAFELASLKIPVLYSANMSIGLQIFIKALEALKNADGFEVSIKETHHQHKKDKPSGTALMIDAEIQKIMGRPAQGIESFREGEVIGDHRVVALSKSESLVFEHRALNRSVFARGACRAARWLVGRPPGFYALKDIL